MNYSIYDMYVRVHVRIVIHVHVSSIYNDVYSTSAVHDDYNSIVLIISISVVVRCGRHSEAYQACSHSFILKYHND